MKLRSPRALLIGAIAVTLLIGTSALADGLGRGALRQVVAACYVAKSTLGLSFPCTDVRLAKSGTDGYAIIRSPGFDSEFLLAPLAPFNGIETPELKTDAATDFWRAAWAARTDVAAALGHPLPRAAVALAVNASGTRTQDHFHIHIDCLRPTVGKVLSADTSSIGEQWAKLPTPVRGDIYWARTIPGSDLSGVNVARLLAAAPPASDNPMGDATLAVIPATLADGTDGFYLLANWENTSAERLLDHDCRGR
jgi:CDP-diacylglycerol pyrophosphatase